MSIKTDIKKGVKQTDFFNKEKQKYSVEQKFDFCQFGSKFYTNRISSYAIRIFFKEITY